MANSDKKVLRLDLMASVDEVKYNKMLTDALESQLRQHLNAAFNSGSFGQVPGVGYNTVRITAERLLLDRLANADAEIQAIIDEHWPTLLREATLKALNHKANAIAFGKAKAKLPLDIQEGT